MKAAVKACAALEEKMARVMDSTSDNDLQAKVAERWISLANRRIHNLLPELSAGEVFGRVGAASGLAERWRTLFERELVPRYEPIRERC